MDKQLYKVLRLPCLPDSPPGVHLDNPQDNVSWRDDDLELNCFSGGSEGSAVVDLTMPQPKKRKITDYFAPAATQTVGMPYFLQWYIPQRSATKPHEDGTGGPTRESPVMISGSSTSHSNQVKCSAVNKTYTLA